MTTITQRQNLGQTNSSADLFHLRSTGWPLRSIASSLRAAFGHLPPAVCLLPAASLLIALCWVGTTQQASAQERAWVRQQSGTLAWLHSVFFLDQNRGWVVGSKGTLLATEDGGRSWQSKPRPSADVLRDIFFSDELNGWVVCERNVYDLKTKTDPRTYLMSTTDGGEHWNRVAIRGADVDARLVRAFFRPSGRGWTFGEGGVIYTSSDAGASWVRLQPPTRHLLLGGAFIDDNRGWFVGAGSTIIQTSDGGETWHLSVLPAAKGIRFTSLSIINNRLGWTVGSSGSIYRTVNGGRTWQKQNTQVSADLLDVKFINEFEGWAVGEEGTVVHTTDGGDVWKVEASGTTHPLERVFFADRTHGWAVGFGGTIVTYGTAEAPSLRK